MAIVCSPIHIGVLDYYNILSLASLIICLRLLVAVLERGGLLFRVIS